VIVLDTNVASELMRPAPSPTVTAWFQAQRPSDLVATSITVAEILFGIERLVESRRKALLVAAATEVFSAFAERVLAFDARAAVPYAQIVSTRERSGKPISGFDAQIAAICHVHGASLATRNTRDFVATGVVLIDPWADQNA
jgi:toxin FitB